MKGKKERKKQREGKREKDKEKEKKRRIHQESVVWKGFSIK